MLRALFTSALLSAAAHPASANADITFTLARASGTILQNSPGGVVAVPFEKSLTDVFHLGADFPRDTIPSHVLLEFAWHAEPVPPATRITGYHYKFNGQVVSVGPEVESVAIDLRPAGADAPNTLTSFAVEAQDDAHGGSFVERYFLMNFAPDTWFSGPDPASIPVVPGSGGQRYVNVADWSALPPIPNSLLSCDSLTQLPSQRPERRTFFEFYQDRIYLRAEGDTVNRGSWLLFHHGGFDVDSPYAVDVAPGTPIPDSAACAPHGNVVVLTPAGTNGSPVGIRVRVPVADPGGALTQPSETTTYPVFDPASVFHQPVIGGYQTISFSGRAYAVGRAVDGQGRVDRRIDQAGGEKAIVDRVEQGTATPEDLALRPKILTFYVNRAPVVEFEHSGFFPRPEKYSAGQVAGTPDRTLRLRYFANDPDPWDPSRSNPPGGPTSAPVLRYTTTVSGTTDQNTQASYAAPVIAGGTSASQDIDLAAVAPQITSADVTVRIQVCDCILCDQFSDTGRCVTYDVPVHLGAPASTPGPGTPALALAGFEPNPALDAGAIAFSLPDDRPAALEMFDTSGRRVWSTQAAFGAGRHTVRLERSLAPGVYILKLSHGGDVRLAQAVLVR